MYTGRIYNIYTNCIATVASKLELLHIVQVTTQSTKPADLLYEMVCYVYLYQQLQIEKLARIVLLADFAHNLKFALLPTDLTFLLVASAHKNRHKYTAHPGYQNKRNVSSTGSSTECVCKESVNQPEQNDLADICMTLSTM